MPSFNEYTRYLYTNPEDALMKELNVLNTSSSEDVSKSKKIQLSPAKSKNAANISIVIYQVDVEGYKQGRFHRNEIEKDDDGKFSNAKVYKTYTLEEAASKFGITVEAKAMDAKERRAVLTAVRKAITDAVKGCSWCDTRIDASDRDDFINGDEDELSIVSFDIFKPNEKNIPKEDGDRRLEEMNQAMIAGVKAGRDAIPAALKSKYKIDTDGDKTDGVIYIQAKG
jgi:hypothetical protein